MWVCSGNVRDIVLVTKTVSRSQGLSVTKHLNF